MIVSVSFRETVCALLALISFFACLSIASAQECGGSGSFGMTNCNRGDPNVPLVPKPFNPRPAGPDTVGPGSTAPPSGPPLQDRGKMRGQTPPSTIAR